MKLSEYARQVGVTYKTAYQWWKAGQLDAYQRPTGTIIVREPQTAATGAALYTRVSSAEQKADVTRSCSGCATMPPHAAIRWLRK